MIKMPIDLEEGSLSANFRHGGWAPIRKRVFEALTTTEQPINRRNAFARCGSAASIMESDTLPREYRISAVYCHDRLCTPCANARSHEIAKCLLERTQGKVLSFITLTLCGRGEALRPMLDRLYKSFRALRAHPTWAEAVRGGAAFLEVKWSDKAERWHPHLHLIAEAKWINAGELSTIWRTITKDSYIVDIRRVKDDTTVQHYVTKYASKPLNSSFANSPSLLQEAVISLKGRRLCFCFGSWYKTPLHEIDSNEEAPTSWSPIATLDDILALAKRGDLAAIDLIGRCNQSTAYRRFILNTS